jgi:hypothetical protein
MGKERLTGRPHSPVKGGLKRSGVGWLGWVELGWAGECEEEKGKRPKAKLKALEISKGVT